MIVYLGFMALVAFLGLVLLRGQVVLSGLVFCTFVLLLPATVSIPILNFGDSEKSFITVTTSIFFIYFAFSVLHLTGPFCKVNIRNILLLSLFPVVAIAPSVILSSNVSDSVREFVRFLMGSTFTVVIATAMLDRTSASKGTVYALEKIIFIPIYFAANVLSFFGVIEYLTSFRIIEFLLNLADIQYSVNNSVRILSLTGNSVVLGCLLSATLPIGAYFLTKTKSSGSFILQFISFSIVLFGLALTGSRSAWIAVIVATVLIAVEERKVVRIVVPGALIIGLTMILSQFTSVLDPLVALYNERLDYDSVLESGSYTFRLFRMSTAFLIFSSHPIWGMGYATFRNVSYNYDIGIMRGLPTFDNMYLSLMAESGIISLLCVFMLAVFVLRSVVGSLWSNTDEGRVVFYLGVSIISIFVTGVFFDLQYWVQPVFLLFIFSTCILFTRHSQIKLLDNAGEFQSPLVASEKLEATSGGID